MIFNLFMQVKAMNISTFYKLRHSSDFAIFDIFPIFLNSTEQFMRHYSATPLKTLLQIVPVLIDIEEVNFSCRASIKPVNRSSRIANKFNKKLNNLSLVIQYQLNLF
jgi:hypothetical protein